MLNGSLTKKNKIVHLALVIKVTTGGSAITIAVMMHKESNSNDVFQN